MRDTFEKLARLEIGPEVLELTQATDNLIAFLKDASSQELKAFTEEVLAFRERIGGPLLEEGRVALAGDPIERCKAAALGYYMRALVEVYRLRRLLEQQSESQGQM
jgi:hypothetical protein